MSAATHVDAVRILIADEDAAVRDVACRKLVSQGYECECCADKETAFRLLSLKQFDLVLTGLLDEPDGGAGMVEEVTRISPGIAVVVITSDTDIDLAVNSLKHGAYDYIVKPCSAEEMSIRIARALEKRRLLHENQSYQRRLEEQVARRTRQLKEALGILEQTYYSTLVALSKALDSRDADPENYSLRVAALTVHLARRLGLSQSEISAIEKGVLLHDIGKIGIPDELLHKSEPLNEQERLLVHRHPIIGYNILSSIKFLKQSAQLVLHHHERYDGKGYPQNLKGDEINLGARLFAVAEEFERLASDQPGRKALNFDSAVYRIQSKAGSQLDPEVVKAFSAIPLSEWQTVYQEVLTDSNKFHFPTYGVVPNIR